MRLAPLYDVISTAAYPELSQNLSLGIGDVFEPDAVGLGEWDDFAS
ncbi:hypothetical protein [Candidatus Solirubrobacter pratensis]|nr:hypothetical protein [Candidatus Solirubrobacter pratensis]